MNDKRVSYLPIDLNECILLLQALTLSEVGLVVKRGEVSKTRRQYEEMKKRLRLMQELLEAKLTVAKLEQEFELPGECRGS